MSGAGLRLAVGLLTVVPVRPPERIDRPVARSAMLLSPLAVLPVAAVAGAVGGLAVTAGLAPAVAGVLAVVALALGTRAMHLDGLADTTDGLGSGRDADGALAIMRRGDVGPMGVVALVLALGAETLAAGALLARPWGWVHLAVLVCCSRAALLIGCLRGVPAARPDGLGALVADSVPPAAAAAVWVTVAAAAALAGVASGQPWWLGAVGVVAASLACWWLLRRCVRRLGGITGDVLGALVEVATAVLLVVAAA